MKQINLNRDPKDEVIHRLISETNFRLQLVWKNHFWFFHYYFRDYITFPTAEFQKGMFSLTEIDSPKMVIVVAFRGSAKSTIFTMSYPLWAILGKQQKKFVIILSQTQRQAQHHLASIKSELERNPRLCKDLGPFREETDTWGRSSLVIPRYGARITAVSIEQPIRGLRHLQHRPDLIIADDIEDIQSVKTKEGRDKTYDILQGEIIPAGGPGTKVVVVGNLLHEDSVMMRLSKAIEEKKIDAVFKAYPLIDSRERIIWPGKYPTMEAVEAHKRQMTNDRDWQRELLLRLIPDAGQIVHSDHIHYYDQLPNDKELLFIWTGVDLAISKKDRVDRTAMVSAAVYGTRKDWVIYILANPINEKLDFLEATEKIKEVSRNSGAGSPEKVFVEDVAYQAAVWQQLESEGYPVEGVKIMGQDKGARLMTKTHLIQTGRILFPRHGAEDLIQQLVGFGVERHDDLVDAFTLIIGKILEEMTKPRPSITFFSWDDDWNLTQDVTIEC